MSKRIAETQMGREPNQSSDGFTTPNDTPKQATAAQLAARKIKAFKKPSARAGRSFHTPNTSLQPSGFENLNFSAPNHNTTAGSSSPSQPFPTSQPHQPNGGFQFGFSQPPAAPQTNGFNNSISSSFPPTTVPQSQSHNFAPTSTSFSFGSSQTSTQLNPFANLNGSSAPNNNVSGFSGSLFNLPAPTANSRQNQQSEDKSTEPRAPTSQSQSNNLVPTTSSFPFTSNQEQPVNTNPFANLNGLNTSHQNNTPATSQSIFNFSSNNQVQNKPSGQPTLAEKSSTNINGEAKFENTTDMSNPFKMPFGTQGFGQAGQSPAKPSEQTTGEAASSTGLASAGGVKPGTPTSFFKTAGFGTGNQTQDKPSQQGSSFSGAFPSTPCFGQANQDQNKPLAQSGLFPNPATSTPSFGSAKPDQKSSEQPASSFKATSTVPGLGLATPAKAGSSFKPTTSMASFGSATPAPAGSFFKPTTSTAGFGSATPAQAGSFFKPTTSTASFGSAIADQKTSTEQSSPLFKPTSSLAGFGSANPDQKKSSHQPEPLFKPTTPTPGFGQADSNQNKSSEQGKKAFIPTTSSTGFGQADSDQNKSSEQGKKAFMPTTSSTGFGQGSVNHSFFKPVSSLNGFGQAQSFFKPTTSSTSFGQAKQEEKQSSEQAQNFFKPTTSSTSFDQAEQGKKKLSENAKRFFFPTNSTPSFGQANQDQNRLSEQASQFFKPTSSIAAFGRGNIDQNKPSEETGSLFPKPATTSFGQNRAEQDKASESPTTPKNSFAALQGTHTSKNDQPLSSSSVINPPPSSAASTFGQQPASMFSTPKPAQNQSSAPEVQPTSSFQSTSAPTSESSVSYGELLAAVNEGLQEHLQKQPTTAEWSQIMKTYLQIVEDIKASNAPSHSTAETAKENAASAPQNGPVSGQATATPEKSSNVFQSTRPSDSGLNFLGAGNKRKADEDISRNEEGGSFSAKRPKSPPSSLTPTPKASANTDESSETSSLMKNIVGDHMQVDQDPQKQSTASSFGNFGQPSEAKRDTNNNILKSSSSTTFGSTSNSSSPFNSGKENKPPATGWGRVESEPRTSSFSKLYEKTDEYLTSGSNRPTPSLLKGGYAPKSTSPTSPPPSSKRGFGEMSSDDDGSGSEKDDAEPNETKKAKVSNDEPPKVTKSFQSGAKPAEQGFFTPLPVKTNSFASSGDSIFKQSQTVRPTKTGSFTSSGHSVFSQPQATQPAKMSSFATSGQSIFSQPQAKPAAMTENLFGHLGKKQDNATDFDDGEGSDDETLESAAHKAKSSPPSEIAPVSSSQGKSLFDRIQAGPDGKPLKAQIEKPEQPSLFAKASPAFQNNLFGIGTNKPAVGSEKVAPFGTISSPAKEKSSTEPGKATPFGESARPAKSNVFGFDKNKPALESGNSKLFGNASRSSSIFGFDKNKPAPESEKSTTVEQSSSSTPSKGSLFGFEKSQGSVGDFTWKPDSPVRFNNSSNTPTQPTFKYTAPTPTNSTENPDAGAPNGDELFSNPDEDD
ncbi:MAG: hypothetical protein Q9157_006892, partial [Trypethelium eluteriae]